MFSLDAELLYLVKYLKGRVHFEVSAEEDAAKTGLYFKMNNELTFAKLFAQCELVSLYQDLLKTGQQPATQPFQQLGHTTHH